MKKLINYITLLIIVIVTTSCEDVVQVKLDKGEPMITIDAFVDDLRAPQKIKLTFTDDYFSQKSNPIITGASVSIIDLTSSTTYTFTDNNNGEYIYTPVAGDTLGRVGHQYKLIVNYKGTEFNATSTMHRTTQVDSLICEYKEGGGLSNAKPGYEFSFLGFDIPGDTVDYYWIKSYRNGVFFNKGIDINIAADGAYGQGADGFPFIYPIASGITPFGELYNQNDICRVEIHSIDLITFNFLTQVQTQTTNSGLFATSPENIKTNITNQTNDKIKVVGWFCMSAVGFKEAIAQ